MDWMYTNSSETVDREEYLLGKAIDKNFESQLSGSFNEVDKDITPASIFNNSGSNLQVDVIRKLKEDPLEQIRQKELETRKQLLKNPVKLKKLQNMLRANRDKEEQEVLLKKKAKKKKKKSHEIDQLLTSKFLQLKGKLGGKNLVDFGRMECGNTREERNRNETKASKKKKRSKSVSSSSSDSSCSSVDRKEGSNRDSTKKFGKLKEKYRDNSPKRENDRDECKLTKKYGLDVRGQDRKVDVEQVMGKNKPFSSRKFVEKSKPVFSNKNSRKRLTEEEKTEKLKEMSQNAAWRSQLTTKNLKRYKEEQKKEKESSQKVFDEGFFRRQMAIATSHTTVQERIKSNVNNIQRSERHMNENFARR